MASASRRSRTSGQFQFVPSDEAPDPVTSCGRLQLAVPVYSAPPRRSSRASGVSGRNYRSSLASYRSRQGSHREPVEEVPLVEVDSKTKSHYPRCCTVILGVLLVWTLFAGGFLMGFYFYHEKMCDRPDGSKTNSNTTTTDGGDERVKSYWNDPKQMLAVHSHIVNHSISQERISHSLRRASSNPQVLTGSTADDDLVQEIKGAFDQYSFDNVEVHRYDMLLPMSKADKPNQLQVLDSNDTVLYDVTFEKPRKSKRRASGNFHGLGGQSSDYHDYESEHSDEAGDAASEMTPFVAYSPSVKSLKGDLVYLHYGRKEDVDGAEKLGVSFTSRVVLVRMGKTSVSDKVAHLVGRGLEAVLLYVDPEDSGLDCDEAVPYASLVDSGDPFTTSVPAMGGVMTQTVEEFSSSQIPAQTVSCVTAQQLLGRLGGVKAPPGWQTGLNLTLHVGRKSTKPGPWSVQLSIHNVYEIKPVYNIIGTVQGREDSDQYVLVGASRTGFTVGGASAAVGTSLLQELAHSLSRELKQTWRPRRTLKLCSWGGAEYGNLGMLEFTEGFRTAMTGQTVAYVDLDQPVLGDTLTAAVSPSLQNMLDVLAHRVFNATGQAHQQPQYREAGSSQFGNSMWVPSVHIQYTDQKDPHVRVLQDTPLQEGEGDMMAATTALRLSTRLALLLSDANIIQYNTGRSVDSLMTSVWDLAGSLTATHGVPSPQLTDLISTSASQLQGAVDGLQYFMAQHLDYSHSAECRQLNIKLMHFQSYCARMEADLQAARTQYGTRNKITTPKDIEELFIGFLNDFIQLYNILRI